MATTNTDLTEEDAADLQFPKEGPSALKNLLELNEMPDLACVKCNSDLVAPYIYCVQCKINLCAPCFASGAELSQHKNDHDYQIIRDDFPLFGATDWTAREESVLLDSLHRYGNWNVVARELPSRSVTEIRKHYDNFYLRRRGSDLLPVVQSSECIFQEPVVPYKFLIDDSDEPPRYKPNTVGYQSVAGYNPARSDFENDFDSNAEDLLSGLKSIDQNDPHYDLLAKLQCGVVESYNRRLLERQRWKRIIRNHGLIVLRKVYAWLHRYDYTIRKPVYEKLIRFMQFCTPLRFELIMEGLHRSGELKVQILKLCELRQRGITTLSDARLYRRLKSIHDDCENQLRELRMNPNFNWKIDRNVSMEIPTIKRKSSFTPIDIVGMPGFDKLTDAERELCKNVRLVPIAYLELKELLVSENNKMGSLKLKTARKMLKIDVNKTRRLFDFLAQEGYINKS